jgi:hypothetical protein
VRAPFFSSSALVATVVPWATKLSDAGGTPSRGIGGNGRELEHGEALPRFVPQRDVGERPPDVDPQPSPWRHVLLSHSSGGGAIRAASGSLACPCPDGPL